MKAFKDYSFGPKLGKERSQACMKREKMNHSMLWRKPAVSTACTFHDSEARKVCFLSKEFAFTGPQRTKGDKGKFKTPVYNTDRGEEYTVAMSEKCKIRK